MSINTFSDQKKNTLADRLNKRRGLRGKQSLDRKSANQSPITTQSPDRTSSKYTNQLSSSLSTPLSDGRKSSSISFKNSDLPSTDNFLLQQNYMLSDNQTNSPLLLEQVTKSQSLEPIEEKETLPESSFIIEQQNYSHEEEQPMIIHKTISPAISQSFPSNIPEKPNLVRQETYENSHSTRDEEPIIIKETNSSRLPPVISPRIARKHNVIQQEPNENSHSYHNEEPVNFNEITSSRLPPIVPPRNTRKPNPIQKITHEHPILNQIRDHSETLFDSPSSYPQYVTDRQQKYFDFPPSYSTPDVRSISDQMISTNKYRAQPINPGFAKPNYLALSYVFNKRIADAELTRTSSLNSDQTQQKTDWD